MGIGIIAQARHTNDRQNTVRSSITANGRQKDNGRQNEKTVAQKVAHVRKNHSRAGKMRHVQSHNSSYPSDVITIEAYIRQTQMKNYNNKHKWKIRQTARQAK